MDGVLGDGTYDGVVVDVEVLADGGGVAVELAIAAGEHRGAVVRVVDRAPAVDEPLDLLGLPATLTVTDGEPTVVFDAEP